MKLNKKQLSKYNQPDTVAVVSLYPKRHEVYSAGASGVASYTKNVVKKLAKPAVILADILPDKRHAKGSSYEEDGSLVVRNWHGNHPFMWVQVFSLLRQLSQVRSLLIHFDFSMYGGMLTSGLMLPFLAMTRLLGFQPTVVSHHVIKDVRKLSGQVGLGTGLSAFFKVMLYNFVFKTFYWLLGKVASNVVVLEEPLQERLSGVISDKKLVTIPHAVDSELATPSKTQARKRLGYDADEAIVMFFGYVNWFKGADFFAQTVKDITHLNGKKVRFVMAGGESPTMKEKDFYQKMFKKVTDAVASSPTLELTGYVPQEKIADYFAASDLVVFPYREFMCASGVLSLVFSYQKPFIVSDQMAPMLTALDFSATMKQVGLESKDMVFSLNKKSLVAVMEKVLENGLKKKMRNLARHMCSHRSFEATANLYTDVLKPTQNAPLVKWAKGALVYAVEE